MQIVKKTLAKLSNYPRLRVLLIIVGLIIVFIIGMNLFSSGDSNNNKPSAPPSSLSPITDKSSQTQPVAPVQRQNYDTLAKRADTAEMTQQIQSGQTLFSNAFQTTGKPASAKEGTAQRPVSSNVPVTKASTPAQAASPAPVTVVSPEQAAQARASNNTATPAAVSQQTPYQQPQQTAYQQQQQAAYQQQQQQLAYQQQQAAMQKQQQLAQLQQSMSSSIQGMSQSWKLPTQTVIAGSASNNNGPGSGGSGSAPQSPVAIKAGTIMFAVTETALDSDQPGTPVMASIVAGPYTGALLLGSFKLAGDKLVVTFTQMSLKSQPSTISIGTAYAIDSQTANNAVATSVDNHYLLRYGMLFAGGFLQGFGSAYQSYNYQCPSGTSSCTIINSNGTPNPTATTTTAAYQGLGQVGTNLGQVAASQFNTPPTVTLAQGTGIGILFMNDVRIP